MKKMRFRKNGYVFPMILLATLSVAFFIISLFQLESSHREQLLHLNSFQHSLNVAYSITVEQLAKLKENQWAERFFRDKPFIEMNKKLFGSAYDVCVEDYNTADYTFNIKIRTTTAGKTNLFYWRQKYIPNMLDFTKLTIPIFFGDLEPELFEPSKKSELDKLVDEKLKNLEKNREKAGQISGSIIKTANPVDALEKIAAIPPGKAGSILGGSILRPSEVALNTKESTADKIEIKSIINSLDGLVADVDKIKYPNKGTVSTNGGNLHVRNKPWGTIVSQLPDNSVVDVKGLRGDFFEISLGGSYGYCHINYMAVPGHIPSMKSPPFPPGVDRTY